MNGWKLSTETEKRVDGYFATLTAEPIIGEIDEKLRNMAADLSYKVMTAETSWLLMLMPLSQLETLKGQIDGEIERRKEEAKSLAEREGES